MFELDTTDRVLAWRKFREKLDDLTLEEALEETSKFWLQAPLTKQFMCPYDKETWMNPWELLEYNKYCDFARALGIFYTLCFTSHSKYCTITLSVYRNKRHSEDYNLVVVNGKYALNFHIDNYVNIEEVPDDSELMFNYSPEALNLK